MADVSAWLILNRCPGLGAAKVFELHAKLGSASTLLQQDRGALRRLGLGNRTVDYLCAPNESDIANDLAWLDAKDNHLLTLDDDDYPKLLNTIPDPPPVLYVTGNVRVLSHPQFAVVGSRHPTPSGRDTSFAFARFLASSGLAVTSGLASGIDAAAHRGALASDGLTIAVCGTGPDRVYPPDHESLAKKIATNGALVTEFPFGAPPKKGHFPRRNRIISGLSLGTLVVEAAARSGSLITARLAMEQGREVFAIPGSIHSPVSRGCHRLIREGAKLVESAADIFDELRGIAGLALDTAPGRDDIMAPKQVDDLDTDYRKLLDFMGAAPLPIDILVDRSGLTPAEVSSMLLIMELKGLVESTPDGKYGLRLESY